jgi:hypothetical protein
LEQIDTPLDQDFPSGRVTELTEHVPINHWHESAVALASQVISHQQQKGQVKKRRIQSINGNDVLYTRSKLTEHHGG